MPSLETTLNVLLLVFGFGFVIFWHELGHFIAAKWAGVKVDQFAVGFGQAICSWRKGIGFRLGNTRKEFDKRVNGYLAAHPADGRPALVGAAPVAARADSSGAGESEAGSEAPAPAEPNSLEVARASEALGLGETEYRLNWLPLGGYVKMLGQDDLRPNAEAEDPRAFNRQPIGKRMVIVSAGVIMNIILAAIGFMILFRIGFKVPPAIVGSVVPGSPAQQAKPIAPAADLTKIGPGLLPGDHILSINGWSIRDDWTKIQLVAALCAANEPAHITVERDVDGKPTRVEFVTEPRHGVSAKDFLEFGIMPPVALKAPTLKEEKQSGAPTDPAVLAKIFTPEQIDLKPGDVVTAIDGRPVSADNKLGFLALYSALQRSDGKPISIQVRNGQSAPRTIQVQPHFLDSFGSPQPSFAGLTPRVRVDEVPERSPSFGKLLPGDVILSVSTASGGLSTLDCPSLEALRQRLDAAGKAGQSVSLSVLRGNQVVSIPNLHTTKIDAVPTYGLRFVPGNDEQHAVAADVLAGSAAQKAGVPAGATITSIAGEPVKSWFDVQTQLAREIADHADAPIAITYVTVGGEKGAGKLDLTPEEVAAIQSHRYTQSLGLASELEPRVTKNPLQAAHWGLLETRDFVLEFYLTLWRMVTGDLSAKSVMGPVGIFTSGVAIASKGIDWLIWFLAMISANLAVVNFLPIPIVDGGLFTFLILEKIKGRPLSPKTQAIAQYVGLALLLGVFLFVTYQDVINIPFRMR